LYEISIVPPGAKLQRACGHPVLKLDAVVGAYADHLEDLLRVEPRLFAEHQRLGDRHRRDLARRIDHRHRLFAPVAPQRAALCEMFSIQLTTRSQGLYSDNWTLDRSEEMAGAEEKFGALIRRERESRDLGLREMAKMIGVSPTYLSKIERDEFPPPAEERVRAIAKIIECDPDDLLARAGRVSSDITNIIKGQPVQLAALLRTAKGLSGEDIDRLTRDAQQRRKQE
jgi:DNA-binding Xre family transcriptional regulator